MGWLPEMKTLDRVERMLGRARALALFGRRYSAGLCATGRLRLRLSGRVRLGRRVTFVGGMVPTELLVAPEGELVIGDECLFNYGCSIVVGRSVQVGARCMFASFVRVSDVTAGTAAPVVIGDDVWVAHGAIIEPGVSVGSGSVVSAGAVVTQAVPPGSLAIGNPARSMSLRLVAHP